MEEKSSQQEEVCGREHPERQRQARGEVLMGETDTWQRDGQQGNGKFQSFPVKVDMEAALAPLHGHWKESLGGDMSAPSLALLGP